MKYVNNSITIQTRTVTTKRAVLSGAVLLTAMLSVVLMMAVAPTDAYAQGVAMTGIALEETIVLELTNNADTDIVMLRIWPEPDFNLESFKTERGWTGVKNSVGVIIFTTTEPIRPSESVKFGVKTDRVVQSINWKALDRQENTLGLERLILTQMSTSGGGGGDDIVDPIDPTTNTVQPPDTQVKQIEPGITGESIFRIIPEKPNVGSPIRVTGEKFGPSEEFSVYINERQIGLFNTDEDGNFMVTVRIPDDQRADRTEFTIRDREDREKGLSIRITDIPDRTTPTDSVPLTINGIPNTVNRGDYLNIFGTGDPGSAITAIITTPTDEIINSRAAEIDSKGDWRIDEPVIIAHDSPFGLYTATITDGRESKQIRWTVESDKKILIQPTNIRFERGETISFNGTAVPNKPIDLRLEDPLGVEIGSKTIQVNNAGDVAVEFATITSIEEGTYTLIATQDGQTEFVYVGVGELPVAPVRFELDKLNYKAGDTAIITLSGKKSDIIELVIVDPSDNQKGNTTSIILQSDGRAVHSIKLDGYKTGVYTAVVNQGSTQSEKTFTVGLKTTLGEIDINTTKTIYSKGDPILILGSVDGPHALLTISMVNPAGETVKTIETFSDLNGKISDDSFRIPIDAEIGDWTIKAQGATSFHNIDIQVQGDITEGISISVKSSDLSTGNARIVDIHVTGAKDKVSMEIIAADGTVVTTLEGSITNNGKHKQPWPVPESIVPGTYKITVTDHRTSNEATFEIQ